MSVADDRHENVRRPAAAKAEPAPRDTKWLKVGGLVIRSLFLLVLAVMTAHVSAPQTSSFLEGKASVGDFIRAALGFAVCLWLAIAIFRPRREAEAYRTWLIIGPPLTALLLVCTIAWW